MKQKTVVKDSEFNNPDIDEVEYLLAKVIKVCRKMFFIRLNIDVFMTLNLQILQKLKKLFYQLVLDIRNKNLITLGQIKNQKFKKQCF